MLTALLLASILSPGAAAEPAQAPQRTFLRESFDEPAALKRWRVFGGLRAGEGPQSTVEVREGHLRLAGDERTGRWMVLEKTLPLEAVRWVRLAVRARASKVEIGSSKHVNAGPWLRFDEDELFAPPPLIGTHEWTTLARRYVVPRRARTVTVGLYLSLAGELEIDELVLEEVPDWLEMREGPFLFRWLPGDEPQAAERAEMRAAFERAVEFIGHRPEYAVVMQRYPDREVKEEYTGSRRMGNLESTVVHSARRVDRHEFVHLLALQWGRPVPLLSEGLAVWLDGAVEERPWRELARGLAVEGWIPLGTLIERQTFLETSEEIAHPIAAALIDWIVAEKDRELVKTLYAALNETNLAERNALELEHRLGLRLQELDAAVRARAAR